MDARRHGDGECRDRRRALGETEGKNEESGRENDKESGGDREAGRGEWGMRWR